MARASAVSYIRVRSEAVSAVRVRQRFIRRSHEIPLGFPPVRAIAISIFTLTCKWFTAGFFSKCRPAGELSLLGLVEEEGDAVLSLHHH